MIHHLDNLLRHLFLAKIDELKDEAQVRFQPPDKDWRTYVSPDQAIYLNILWGTVAATNLLVSTAAHKGRRLQTCSSK